MYECRVDRFSPKSFVARLLHFRHRLKDNFGGRLLTVLSEAGFAEAKELAPRGGYWLTATRKHCATSPVNSTWRVSHFATAGRKSAHFSRLRVALSAPLSARVLRPLFTCGVAYEPLPSTTP
jgi:hypothetical protein